MFSRSLTWISDWLEGLGSITLFAKEATTSLFRWKSGWRDFVYQLYFIGVKSQSVVLITGTFTGMVLAAQTYIQFHKFKMDTATLAVVSVSMCSELGPVLTSLMVAGRVGASIAAEIGTMKVTEQIDALRTLATHPVDYLVVPRLLSLFLSMPLLTAESIAIGIAGGYVVAVGLYGVPSVYALQHMNQYTSPEELLVGLVKSIVFGGIVGLIGCYKGMFCGEGAEGVGRATTEAVVYSSITILISNFFLTLTLGQIFHTL